MNSKSNSTDGTEESLESSSFVPLRRPRRPAPSPPVIQPIDTLETDRIRSYDSMQTVRTVDTIDTSDTNPDVLDELEELRDGSESGHDTYTARRSCLGLVIQTLCRQINYYDDERDVHLDFLTATQLQRLIDTHKSQFRQMHPELDSAFTSWSSDLNIQASGSTSANQLNSNEFSFFGCDVNSIEPRTGGLQLPPFIELLLLYLMRKGAKSIGIFRKSGVKSRITALREACDQWPTRNQTITSSNPNESNQQFDSLLESFSVFDAADALKLWLRELRPTPLITQSIVLAYKDFVAGQCDAEKFRLYLVSLMTDGQRYILLILLHMLNWFAKNCASNHMTAQNLAICFAPSLCEIRRNSLNLALVNQIQTSNASGQAMSGKSLQSSKLTGAKYSASFPINHHLLTAADVNLLSNGNSADSIYSEEAEALNDAQQCLEYLITNYDRLLYFNSDLLNCSLEANSTNRLDSYGANNPSVYLLNGGNLLPQKFETNVTIQAAPTDILHRVLYERNLYDCTLLKWEVLENRNAKQNNCFADCFKIWKQSSIFLPIKKMTLNRSWTFFESDVDSKTSNSSNFSSKSCKKSTSHGILLKEEGFLYQSVYKITAIGEGKTCLNYSVAYDSRGHSFYWYQNTFPAIIEQQLERLRESFQVTFPKSKSKVTNV